MDPSRTLLTAYVTHQSEAAFRGLVERELDLVYGVALRRTGGDEGMAREIAQVVFIDLARKAATLSKEMVIAGWLHRHTCFTAAKMIRTEQRRRQRESTAAMEQESASQEQTALWESMAPLLDDVLALLPPEDRDALLLRYLEGRGLHEVGITLGISGNTARMRVNRALEKLRQALHRRGVTSTALALTGALALVPRVQAPEAWAGPIAGLALKLAPVPLAAGGMVTAGSAGGWLAKGAAVLVAGGLIGGVILYKGTRLSTTPPPSVLEEARRPAMSRMADSAPGQNMTRPAVADAPALESSPGPQLVVVSAPGPVPAGIPAPAEEPGITANLVLGVLPAVMKFDPELLTVRAGQAVILRFENAKCPLQHNFVLGKPGTLNDLGALADRMLTDPQAMAKHYLPVSPDILAQSTKLIGLGEADSILFTAPVESGDYPFLCTFPGHWRIMHGLLRVVH
jgi:RNA polymerase sigma factor (sigma-70 family)